jgi:hypothetical protein
VTVSYRGLCKPRSASLVLRSLRGFCAAAAAHGSPLDSDLRLSFSALPGLGAGAACLQIVALKHVRRGLVFALGVNSTVGVNSLY